MIVAHLHQLSVSDTVGPVTAAATRIAVGRVQSSTARRWARQLQSRRHWLRGLSLVAGRLPLWQRLYVPNGCAGMTPSVTSAEALVGGGRPGDQHSKNS